MRSFRRPARGLGRPDQTRSRRGWIGYVGAHRTVPRRGREDSPWRFAASLAMLLAMALGAGLLVAGVTLPPRRPPQPPAAPAGELAAIPGFLPDASARPASPTHQTDSANDRVRADPPADADGYDDVAAGRSDTGSGQPRPEAAAGGGPSGPGGRGLTATRAPAAPPPIPTPPPPIEPPAPPAGDPPARAAEPSGTTSGPAEPASTALPALGRSEPLRIAIPAIGVDARIIGVGVDSEGGMEVPPLDQPMLAGWYRLGPSPGELGNSVLVGHVDTRRHGPGVFFDLGRLRKGDLITISRADGTRVRFAVDDVRLFPKSGFPSHAVFGTGDQSRLRIVTCGGRYDRSVRDYLDNVVAFASRVP